MAQQKILITGSAGNLGQELMLRLDTISDFECIGTTSLQLDFTWNQRKIMQVLNDIKPNIIINTAAFTNVDAAESEYEEALKVNSEGPAALAEWSKDNNCYMVHISTDYIFDGTKNELYEPYDTPNPVNRYGLSKLLGEQAVLKILPGKSLILRTSWLFGLGNKNFVPFIIHAAMARTPVKITMDQQGTPTWTGNLCDMIIETLTSRPEGVMHGCSSGVVNRFEQAKFICSTLGISSDFMTPVTTEFFNFPAKRPMNIGMKSSFKSAMDWQTATEKYLKQQGVLKNHV